MAFSVGGLLLGHKTLRRAIEARRAIDGGGRGGGCCKVHLIAHVDPENGHQAREAAFIEQTITRQGIRAMR
jgi:hypothetical protein